MRLPDRKVVAVLFLLVLLAVFILPFQVVSIHSTVYTGPGFRQIRPNPEVNYYNAYHEVYVIWLHGFFYLTLLFLFFANKRVLLILAIISALLNLAAYIILHEGLLFSFNLFGPKLTLEIGLGYYVALLLSGLLLLFCIIELVNFPKKNSIGLHPELIDDFKQDNK